MNEDTASGVKQAFHRYLNAYFTHRDLGATLALFSRQVSGFGTGLDETAMDPERVEWIYRRDIEQASHSIDYRFRRSPHIQVPVDDLAIVCAELDIKTRVLDQVLILRHLRLTMVFVQHGSDWLIEHKHISFPTDVHGDNESYPFKEIEERNQVLERLVREKTQALQQAVDEISHLATTDRLTGLPNRMKIDDYLDQAIRRAGQGLEALSLIMMDLDHFKRINDTYGHLHGDRILAELSELLSATVRDTDLLGRWGGEEFLVICPGMSLDSALERAEQMRQAVRSHAFSSLGKPQTASFGVACYRFGESRENLIARADVALYRAKLAGRDGVEMADEARLQTQLQTVMSGTEG